ncbi:MAG TPA: protein kinase [Thermoanaerobaculia bacterium]|nr:protein kinase [Thermoanaerobaculia bacterium]
MTEPLGAGGMGEVYRARDSRLDRDVAIKVLPSHLSSNSAVRERFDREARAISRLNHPHVCTLYDVGHQDGVDYLVMEYLEGETLADAIGRGPLPLRQALRVAIDVAGALDTAHRLGIVHRDLKPGNIMLTKSGAKVLDFGLAKYEPQTLGPDDATMQKPLTEEGTIVGTVQYMAPEQLEARNADARTDIFALGSILYEMVTGCRAFEAASRASLIAAIMEREPPPMSTIQPMTPATLDSIVRHCLAKNPDDRFQSARDLQIALEEIGSAGVSASWSRGVPPRPRRWPLYAAAIAVVAIIAAALILFLPRRAPAPASSKTIAVLPFAALGVDHSRDYLRLAIPDEITTILSYSHDLAVRPFSVSRRLSAEIDPQDAGKKLNASHIVSGHLLDEGGHLSVTLEAIDATADKLLWRDVFDVPSADLITMRRELSTRIENGLLPRLDVRAAQQGSRPQNPEAYALYLRAAAAPTDPEPNAAALKDLEHSVQLDPNYAPAWAALALRSYYTYSYADAGPAALGRAQEAAARALSIDPDLVEAATRLIVMRAEDGQTAAAYRDAKRVVTRRPDSAEAHFAVSYASRYGGTLNEAVRECLAARSLDPGNRNLRSCAVVFVQKGDIDRAFDFIRLDAGSAWAGTMTAEVLIRQGKGEEAVRALDRDPMRHDFLSACVAHDAAAIERAAAAGRAALTRGGVHDGEPLYFIAGVNTFCGRTPEAFGILRESIHRGYCAAEALDADPIWAPLRATPEFRAIRQEAQACEDRFLRER